MKPGIPETGIVVRSEGEQAVVRMRGDGSCAKCGVAAAGLCTGALSQLVTVSNPVQARVGDSVKIGLVRQIQYRGFLFAYVIPSVALVLGGIAGHALGELAGFPPLDILGAFMSLVVASFFSLQMLKQLDSCSSIEIVSVLTAGPGTNRCMPADAPEKAAPG